MPYYPPAATGGSTSVTTKGDLQGYSTLAARIPIGTDTQVLTADSAQALGLKWAAAGAGSSGALVFLEAHTASSSATLDFTTFISSTYDEYVFELVGIVPATDAAMLTMRAGTGGGPTYDTSSIYPYSNFWKAVGTTAAVASWGTTATAVSLFNDSAGGGLSNVASTTLSGTLHLFDPGSASNVKLLTWETIFNYYADDGYYRVSGGGFYNSTTAMTAVRFLMSSGNIASGVIRVYGVTKS